MIFLSTLTRRLAIGVRPLSRTVKLPIQASSVRSFTSSRSLLGRRTEKPQFTPSPEQQKILNLCAEQNVVVSARPGSGKTATAEAIVAAYPHLRTALAAYSKVLQLETERRLENYPNARAFTMHAIARLLFGVVVPDDVTLLDEIRNAVQNDELPEGDFEPFDIIVLDEFQDCTDLLFWLVICFIRINTRKRGGQPACLVILGDDRQAIYRFRGADPRYLTLAPELLGAVSPSSFANTSLSESFRLSNQTVQFINRTFLGGDSYITSSKSGPKPIVVRYNSRRRYALARILSKLIKQYGAENSAIIAPSVRKDGSVIKLANILAEEHHIPIAQPIDDDSPLDERIFDGKLCISTIHQFKGRERDLVILLGIDSSFFKLIGRDLPDDTCPNEVFVALTRAVKQLVLVHDERRKLMPFVSVDDMYETAEVINLTPEKTKIAPPNSPGRALQFGFALPPHVSITDMARYVRGERLEEVIQRDLCIQEFLSPEKEIIRMLDVVSSDLKRELYEAVGDINSLVVLAAYQHAIMGAITIFDSNNYEANNEKFPVCLHEQIPWLCKQACKHQAHTSGYMPRQLQMKNHGFNWINPRDLALARDRLQEELGGSSSNLKFGVKAEQYFIVDNYETILFGQADIITVPAVPDSSGNESVESVWKIKVTPRLSNEHIVQACAHAYLLASESGKPPRIILYNVRDGKRLEITPRDGLEGLRRMIESVLRLKFTAEEGMEDDTFAEMCSKTTHEVLSLGDSKEESES